MNMPVIIKQAAEDSYGFMIPSGRPTGDAYVTTPQGEAPPTNINFGTEERPIIPRYDWSKKAPEDVTNRFRNKRRGYAAVGITSALLAAAGLMSGQPNMATLGVLGGVVGGLGAIPSGREKRMRKFIASMPAGEELHYGKFKHLEL